MSCEECRELSTHTFRSADDLVHAIRLATEEVDRGVLCRVAAERLAPSAQEALDSSLESGALPNTVRYRFRCEVCGDRFTLQADTSTGQGGWTREAARSADPLPRSADGVVLRRLAVSDLPVFQAYRRDPVVAQFQGWAAKSDADASAFLAKMSAVTLLRPGVWTQIGIADPDGLDLLGDIGLFVADDGRQVEIGFTLNRKSQGRGIATKAVQEAIDLVFEQTDADQVLGITDARNLKSIRVLQRVGMQMTDSRGAIFRERPIVEHIYTLSRHGQRS